MLLFLNSLGPRGSGLDFGGVFFMHGNAASDNVNRGRLSFTTFDGLYLKMYNLSSCLARNVALDKNEGPNQQEPFVEPLSSDDTDEETQFLALQVIRRKTHIIEQLLVSHNFSAD